MPKNNLFLQKFGTLVLASTSPRRAQLLRQVGFEFDVYPSHVDEDFDHRDPVTVAQSLAERKAMEIAKSMQDRIVLAADTIVVLDEHILNKPADHADARRMLTMLSGRTHQVYTGFCLIRLSDDRKLIDIERTDVTFRRLTNEEIDSYIADGTCYDKAGSYGIQDASAIFVERIDGDFYNVVGLPITKIYSRLNQYFV